MVGLSSTVVLVQGPGTRGLSLSPSSGCPSDQDKPWHRSASGRVRLTCAALISTGVYTLKGRSKGAPEFLFPLPTSRFGSPAVETGFAVRAGLGAAASSCTVPAAPCSSSEPPALSWCWFPKPCIGLLEDSITLHSILGYSWSLRNP